MAILEDRQCDSGLLIRIVNVQCSLTLRVNSQRDAAFTRGTEDSRLQSIGRTDLQGDSTFTIPVSVEFKLRFAVFEYTVLGP